MTNKQMAEHAMGELLLGWTLAGDLCVITPIGVEGHRGNRCFKFKMYSKDD